MHPGVQVAAVRQYLTVRDHVGFIRRDDRRLVRVFGRDPVRMVQGLITNDIAGAPDGQGVYAAMLTPKGRMIADLRAFRVGDDVLIETDTSALDGVTGVLRKYVPPLFARWEPVTDALVLGVYGPESRAQLERIGQPLPAPGAAEDAFAGGAPDLAAPLVIRDGYTGGEGYSIIGSDSAVAAVEAALEDGGVRRIGCATLEVLRIEAGRPRWAAELTPDVFPIEAGIGPRAISTTKGCYTGQEIIIRIMHRGHVNRHLRGLIFVTPDPDIEDVGPGAVLVHESDEVGTGKSSGFITSICRSPRFDRFIGMGYVRRGIHPPATLEVEGTMVEARAVPLPFPSADADSLFDERWPRNGAHPEPPDDED